MPRLAATTARKRPRQARSRATVDVILDATARVLVTTGYDRASTNRVAEVAGVSVGSLYQYFPSKEALVAALVERHSAAVRAVIETQLAEVACAPVPEAVRGLVEALFAAHLVDPPLHRALHEQVPRVGRLGRLLDDQCYIRGLVRAVLATRAAELRRTDLDAVAMLMVATVEAAVHAAVLPEQPVVPPGRLIDELVDMLLRYLAR
ncbi:MAG: TetR/AcrR family transcriptional regulator [Myxococcales bacterium]|nr:MAG: TetR/AcrR family transcriptional regulator [Myxococcales bacterium]